VSGIDAGKVFNTWPLMNGELPPAGLFPASPKWRNIFESRALAQFNHRNFAYLTLAYSLFLELKVNRNRVGLSRHVVRSFKLFHLLVWYQVVAGILMLLELTPPHKASMH